MLVEKQTKIINSEIYTLYLQQAIFFELFR